MPLAAAERAEVVRALRREVADSGMNHARGLHSTIRAVLLLSPLAPTVFLLVHFGTWWAWTVHIAVATAVGCTLPAAYHEATHGSISRNRVVNDTVGVVASALHFVPFATWRYFHLTHHANTGTDKDPEVYATHWSRWTLLSFPVTQWGFVGILWRWTFAALRGAGPVWIRSAPQRRAILVTAVGTVLLCIAEAVVIVLVPALLLAALVPCMLSVMVAAVTLVPEHFPAYRQGPGEPDQLDRTGSFRSTVLVRLVLWNSNFHAAHHFAPKVPAHQLGRLDQMISKVQDPTWRWKGYSQWYRARLRQLGWAPSDISTLLPRTTAPAPDQGEPGTCASGAG